MIEHTSAQTSFSLEKNELDKIRAKAIRRGIWFRTLTKAERAQIELTMRIVKKIRSLFLARVLDAIMRKLLDAMESKVVCTMRKIGRELAEKLRRIAQRWGNKSAHNWTEDQSFVQYLAITYMNTPTIFKA